MSGFATFWLVFTTHLRRMLWSKRFFLMAVASVIPALPILLVGLRLGGERQVLLMTHVAWFLMFQVIAPVISLIGGTAAVAEEVADGTINWVLVRPVSRPAFFLARWLSVMLPVVLAGSLGVGCMVMASRGSSVVAIGLGKDIWGALTAGLFTYTTVFAAIGAWFKRPVIVGLGYAFAMEALLANLPGTTPELSIVHLIRSVAADAGAVWRAGVVNETGIKVIAGADALEQLLILAASALVIGCVATRRRQFGLTVG